MKYLNLLFLLMLTTQSMASEWQFGARDKALLARQHQQVAAACTVIKSVSSPLTFVRSQGKDQGIKGPNSQRQQIFNLLTSQPGYSAEADNIQQFWWENIAGPANCDRFLFWDTPVAAMCKARSDMSGPICDAVNAFQEDRESGFRFIREDELSELLTRQETQGWQMHGAMEAPFESSPEMTTTTRVGNSSVRLSITAPLAPMPWWQGLESGAPQPPDTRSVLRWKAGTPAWVEPVIRLELDAQALWLNKGRRIKDFTLYAEQENGRLVLATKSTKGYLPPPWGKSRARSRLRNHLIVPMTIRNFKRFAVGNMRLDVTFIDGSKTSVKFGGRSSAYYATELQKFWQNRDDLYNRFIAREEARKEREREQTIAKTKREREVRAETAYRDRIKPLQDKAISTINEFMGDLSASSGCGPGPAVPTSIEASDSRIDRWEEQIDRWIDCEVGYQKRLSRRWKQEVNRKVTGLTHNGIKGGLRGDRVMSVYNSSFDRMNSYVRRSSDRLADYDRKIQRWNSRVDNANASQRRRELSGNILNGMRDALNDNQQWYDSTPMYDNSYYVTPNYE